MKIQPVNTSYVYSNYLYFFGEGQISSLLKTYLPTKACHEGNG